MQRQEDRKLMNEIAHRVESGLNTAFSPSELESTRCITVRKMELNRKDDDYFPILFENELRDLYTRKIINLLGGMNLCSCRN